MRAPLSAPAGNGPQRAGLSSDPVNDAWLRRLAWGLAVYAVGVLIGSAVWLAIAAEPARVAWLEVQVRTIVGIGAPILGLIIVRRQPRQRVGWLWLVIGVAGSFRALGYAVFFGSGMQSAGYSAPATFLLWSTEAANMVMLLCQALLLLWFPDGQLASRRWRVLYGTLVLSAAVLALGLFGDGPNWNGTEAGRGLAIENPFGWLPADIMLRIIPFAFLTLVLSTLLAAVSLLVRYRSAGRVVRTQIRWFVAGGLLFVLLNYGPLAFIGDGNLLTNRSRLLFALAFSNSVPLYLAVGLAMLRYRLYDIDVIIRKTLVYAVLSGLLGLVYFGTVVLLQTLFDSASGQQSPLIIVLSTLLLAALAAPLRRRVQDFIDRRFYRRKVDAQRVLARFGQTARDDVDMAGLTAALLQAVQETMQPETATLWLKRVER